MIITFRHECPTCEDGTVETAPMFWGETAEDARPAEFDTCPDCKGTRFQVSEVRDTEKPLVEVGEYDPWAEVA